VLASVGSVGDAYDNALAESFVDSFKTELFADRVWQTTSQLELAVVEFIGWFNNVRLPGASVADAAVAAWTWGIRRPGVGPQLRVPECRTGGRDR
jgi:transposase InsO family protein